MIRSPLEVLLTETPVPDSAVPRYELAEWRQQFGLVAGITGAGPGGDLALATPDAAVAVLERWRAFRRIMRPQFSAVAVGTQRHGTALAVHEQDAGMCVVNDIDGHLTVRAGLLLAVTVADCVPVYLAHPESGTIALLHAGWRGIAAGIVGRGINRLCHITRSSPEQLVIHCGVSICGNCYEVGPEVKEQLLGVKEARGPVDLRAVIAARAAKAAVDRVTASSWCTAHDGPRFYSYRASAGTTHRMLAYLGRPNS